MSVEEVIKFVYFLSKKIHNVEPVIQVFALAVTLVKKTIIDSPPKQKVSVSPLSTVFNTGRELFQSKLHVLY